MSETNTTSRLSRDAQRLVELARSLALSGSHLEDKYWQLLLGQQVHKMLHGKKNPALDSALDVLLASESEAYEALLEQAETESESTRIDEDGHAYDVLLFSAPVIAWTRYQLPQQYGLNKTQLQAFSDLLKTHVLAEGAQFALLPQLAGFDQLPTSFQGTYELTLRLGRAALRGRSEPALTSHSPYEGLLADARFIVGAIVVPADAPLFRWQNIDSSPTRDDCLKAWKLAAEPLLEKLFTGCSIQSLQPDAYYVNNREADRRMRPLALQAAVSWLQNVAGLRANGLRATVVACGQNVPEEYRIGFTTQQGNQVIYGCVWPILGKDEASIDDSDHDEPYVTTEIIKLLNDLGITDARRLPGLFPLDACEDCGAPYFPDPLGDMQHPELPEEIDVTPIHLH
ncbi:DUF2863 family protein [Pusillimonas sp. CC-YST705]|uniref:DUF2863 family protein n=1 Tax=Mesopusillimonas faecipullorum TaxID=2755040 RepID=A0ABS8C879_9BURK|nr:DUF2863 family protein [Mesopusillimonas faecipullorum]MCB5362234.1 DUF2863 family protein [Mesopusillimonas faecipullorum]